MKKRTIRHLSGFTLIELLTVIAIIGILAAIIIPTTSAVRKAAKKAQTRSMFSQWGNAYTLFKQEYGYYPQVGTDGTSFLLSTTGDTDEFVLTFTAKDTDGVAPGTSATEIAKLNGNKRRQSFLTFSNSELPNDTKLLTDAFGNTEIAVVTDQDGDGLIKHDESGVTYPDVGAFAGGTVKGTGSDPISVRQTIQDAGGVRAGVIFYSAGKGGQGDLPASEGVLSWK